MAKLTALLIERRKWEVLSLSRPSGACSRRECSRLASRVLATAPGTPVDAACYRSLAFVVKLREEQELFSRLRMADIAGMPLGGVQYSIGSTDAYLSLS
jgi:hypothetical protein